MQPGFPFDRDERLSPAVQVRREAVLREIRLKADTEKPKFTEVAMAFVQQYLADHGPAPAEVLTKACKAAGILPTDDRHFGAVIQSLSRRKVIVKVGSVPRERGNGCAGGNVWALTRQA